MADHAMRARIFAAIDGTKTARQVADELGVDQRRVRNAAKNMKIDHLLLPASAGGWGASRALIDGTRTAKEIAQITGKSQRSVYLAAKRCGISGRLKASRMKDDDISQILGLSPALAEWLRGQCGAGVGVADVIRGILTDAYLDESEGGGK